MTTTTPRSGHTQVRPPFDPELAAALALVREQIPPSLTPDLIGPMREGNDLMAVTLEMLSREGTVEVSEREVPGPEGDPDVSLLILKPRGVVSGAPITYHTHGGGMIVGDNRTGVDGPLDWAVESGAIVVSVEYRLAPEHPDPAPVEDCYAGLVWTHAHAAELGGDPDRILIAGASAGGGLAAGVALLARDRQGPPLIGQVLMCPMIDDRNETPSSHELDGEGIWDRTSNDTGWDALLGDRRKTDAVSVYAAPSRAIDLSGLPPAFVDVGSVETFRDEDVDYAVRLWRAGVQAELHVWPGGFHGFDMFAPQAAVSQMSISTRAAWVRRLLAT